MSNLTLLSISQQLGHYQGVEMTYKQLCSSLFNEHDWQYKSPDLLVNKIKDQLINLNNFSGADLEIRNSMLREWYSQSVFIAFYKLKNMADTEILITELESLNLDTSDPSGILHSSAVIKLLSQDNLAGAEKLVNDYQNEQVDSGNVAGSSIDPIYLVPSQDAVQFYKTVIKK